MVFKFEALLQMERNVLSYSDLSVAIKKCALADAMSKELWGGLQREREIESDERGI